MHFHSYWYCCSVVLAECLPGFLQLSITRNFLLLFVCFGRQLPPFFYCHAFSTLFLHSSFYPSLGCFLLSPSRSNFIINASSSGTMDSKQAWASSVDCLVICDMSLHGIACVLILWILGWWHSNHYPVFVTVGMFCRAGILQACITVFVVALWWVDAGQMPGTHQSQPLAPLCNWARERKCNEVMGWDKDCEGSLTKIASRAKHTRIGDINWIYY